MTFAKGHQWKDSQKKASDKLQDIHSCFSKFKCCIAHEWQGNNNGERSQDPPLQGCISPHRNEGSNSRVEGI